jgi:hypothetical protein
MRTGSDVVVTLADGGADLDGILALQRENLAVNLASEAAAKDGFVTVVHTRAILEQMHAALPSVVARKGELVVGYALSMPVGCRRLVPILEPMFALLDTLESRGAPLSRVPYYTMGQICVAPELRGTGLFQAMYAQHAASFGDRFQVLVTEVSRRNGRSLRAHQRTGFETLAEYRDATDDWCVIALDLKAKR